MEKIDATPSRSGNLLTTAALALAGTLVPVRSTCRPSPSYCTPRPVSMVKAPDAAPRPALASRPRWRSCTRSRRSWDHRHRTPAPTRPATRTFLNRSRTCSRNARTMAILTPPSAIRHLLWLYLPWSGDAAAQATNERPGEGDLWGTLRLRLNRRLNLRLRCCLRLRLRRQPWLGPAAPRRASAPDEPAPWVSEQPLGELLRWPSLALNRPRGVEAGRARSMPVGMHIPPTSAARPSPTCHPSPTFTGARARQLDRGRASRADAGM